jgi:hypothetical protein
MIALRACLFGLVVASCGWLWCYAGKATVLSYTVWLSGWLCAMDCLKRLEWWKRVFLIDLRVEHMDQHNLKYIAITYDVIQNNILHKIFRIIQNTYQYHYTRYQIILICSSIEQWVSNIVACRVHASCVLCIRSTIIRQGYLLPLHLRDVILIRITTILPRS